MAASVLPFRDARASTVIAVSAPAELRWAALPEWARSKALERRQTLQPALDKVAGGIKAKAAARWLKSRGVEGLPSLPTLERWIAAAIKGHLVELAPKHKGRARGTYGWEVRALELYANPTKPGYSTVAYWLQEEGFESATESRVKTYLKSLPANLTDASPKRNGANYTRQNIRLHHRRDPDSFEVGQIYMGDGHRCDVYVQHPSTGKAYRPELIVWMDMRSRKIVGWCLTEDESGISVLYALSDAIRRHNHVPEWIYTDPGSGFKNKLMSNEDSGFYALLNMRHRTAIPGNARAKGGLEGWFSILEERFGKRWESYCGHCRTDDLLARLQTKIRRGQLKLPTREQFLQALIEFIERYNQYPQPDSHYLQGAAPDDLWPRLQRNEYGLPPDTLLRPEQSGVKVFRTQVQFRTGFYHSPELAAYEGRKVRLQYDLNDASAVWVRDEKGRFIAEARICGHTTPFATRSVMEQQSVKSLEGKIARLQRHQDEAIARARGPVTAEASLRGLSHFDALELPAPDKEIEGLQPLDLHDTDY